MDEQIERLIRLPEVESRVGLRRSTIYRRIKGGDFPAPLKLATNVAVWPESAINKWVLSQVGEGVGMPG